MRECIGGCGTPVEGVGYCRRCRKRLRDGTPLDLESEVRRRDARAAAAPAPRTFVYGRAVVFLHGRGS